MIDKKIQDMIFKYKKIIAVCKKNKESIKTNFLDTIMELGELGFYIKIQEDKEIISILRHNKEIIEFLSSYMEEDNMKDNPLFRNYNKMFSNFNQEEIQEIMTLKSVLAYYNPVLYTTTEKDQAPIPDVTLTPISILEYEENHDVAFIIIDLIVDKLTLTTPFSKNDIDELKILLSYLNLQIPPYDIQNVLKESVNGMKIKSNIFTYIEIIMKMGQSWGYDYDFEKSMMQYIESPTDLIRFLNEDKTLSEIKPPVKIGRSMRKYIMQCFDKFNIWHTQDIKSKSKYWKKIAHLVHPNEYPQYTNAISIFNKLYEGKLGKSFIHIVDGLLANKTTFFEGIELLSMQPTVFTRNILRICKIFFSMGDDFVKDNKAEFLKQCREVFSKSSKKSLIALSNRIINIQSSDFQIYSIRGLNGKMYVKENPYKDMAKNIFFISLLNNVIIEIFMSLKKIYRDDEIKEEIQSVYIDHELLDYTIPMYTMSESKSLYVTPRWSRIQIKKEQKDSIIRAFIHWKGSYVDVDLNASLWDKNGNNLAHCSFCSLGGIEGVTHSGDVRTAPDGATEFIDINSEAVKKKYEDARYIVISVNSYSGEPMKDIDECFGGFEVRDKKYVGEDYTLYSGANASNILYFENNGTTVIPFIIDLIEEKVISADINGQSVHIEGNVESDSDSIGWLIKGINSKKLFTSIYELVLIYYAEKGIRIVEHSEDADFIVDKTNIREITKKII
jgi:hypothetical protein